MKNNSLYVKDSQTLRIGLCVYVIIMEIFQFLWTYVISPISNYYLEALQTPLAIICTLLTFIKLIIFIVLTCFNLEKSWKFYYLSSGIFLSIGFITGLISTYDMLLSSPFNDFDGNTNSLFLAMLPYVISNLLTNIIPAICLFLMLTEKKFFKYVLVVGLSITLLFSFYSILSEIPDVIEPHGSYSVGTYILNDSEKPFLHITSMIDKIPTYSVALLFITFFIGFKKKPKATSIQANSYAYDMSYQPNAYPTTYNPEYFYNNTPYTPPEVKYCPMCGNQANLSDFFCGKCGHAFNMQ